MLKVEFSEEYNQAIVNEIVKQLVPVLLQELQQNQLPHLMDRNTFMEVAGVGRTKCNELFHRRDFPVNKEMGHPKVLTKAFFEWVYATNQNASEVNLKYPYEVV